MSGAQDVAATRIPAQARTCVIIRTHYVDEQVLRLIDALAAAGPHDLCVFADERLAPLPLDGVRKVALTEELMARLRILSTPDVGWRCGDYGFYAVCETLPRYDYYWLIEGDVYFNCDPADFFRRHEGCGSDFLSANLRPRDAEWFWHAAMQLYRQDVYGCSYALVRLSRRAAEFLLERRQRLTEEHIRERRRARLWPNDEAFTATELLNNGYRCDELGEIGNPVNVGGQGTFGVILPYNRLRLRGYDGRIYHSVYSGRRLFEKAKAYAERMPGESFGQVLSQVQIECGPQEAADLVKVRDAALLRSQGEAFAAAGNWDAAQRCIDEAATILASRPELHDQYSRLIGFTARLKLERIAGLQRSGRSDEARREIAAAAKLPVNAVRFWKQLAGMAMAQDRDLAGAVLRAGVALNAGDDAFRIAAARIALDMRIAKRVPDVVTGGLDSSSPDPGYWERLRNLLRRLGDKTRAEIAEQRRRELAGVAESTG